MGLDRTECSLVGRHAPSGAMAALCADGPCGLVWSALCCDAGVWVFTLSAAGVLLDVNDQFARECGRRREDLSGKSLQDLMPPEPARERLDLVARVLGAEETVTLDSVVAGCRRFCTLRPMRGVEGGRPDRVLVVSRLYVPGTPPAMVKATHNDMGPLSVLTDRELEVLAMIAVGHSTARIAKELHRSVKTIEWHRVSLGSKLGVSNRVELARLAFRAGLASPFELPPLEQGRSMETDAPK